MKHGTLYFIIAAILVGISISGCRAKKDIARNEEVQKRVERIERQSDSARIEQLVQERSDHRIEESEVSYTRVIDLDSTGRVVLRVSETWRDGRSSHVSIQDNRAEAVSITASQKEVMERDSSSVVTSELYQVTTDSRPVQGVEWVWIIIGLVIAVAVILFIRRKVK